MLDINKIVILEEFSSRLKARGSISKSDVLSLESIVGSGVITSNMNINMYSNIPTAIYFDETVNMVDELASKARKNLDISMVDLINYIRDVKSNTTNLIGLLNQLTSISLETLSSMINNNIAYYYDEEDNLRNVLDKTLFDVLYSHSNYLGKVFKTDTQCGIEVFNKFHEKLSDIQVETYADYVILPLLSNLIHGDMYELYNNKTIDIRELTVRDFVEGMSKINVNKARLQVVIDELDVFQRNLRDVDSKTWNDKLGYLNEVKSRLDTYNGVVCNVPSLKTITLLNILAEIK